MAAQPTEKATRAVVCHTTRAVILMVLLHATSLVAHGGKPGDYQAGSTSRADRQNALMAIPYDQLLPEAAGRIHRVTSKPSVYRRLPVETVDCDPDLFVFLVRNPEIVVNVWQLMGVTQLTMDRAGPFEFTSSDGAGTNSNVELVYGTPHTHLYYGNGVYEGPLLKKRVTGQCVLLLRSEYLRSATGPAVRCRLDVFMQVEQGAVDMIAKTFHPLFGKAADMNFVETATFLERMSQTAAENSEGMQHLSDRLTRVSLPVRENFVRIASGVEERIARRSRVAHQRSPG